MKKGKPAARRPKMLSEIHGIPMRTDQEVTKAAVKLLRASGIKASTDPGDLGRPDVVSLPNPFSMEGEVTVWIPRQDSDKAHEVLRWAMRYGHRRQKRVTLPPEMGTLEYLDMLIHDSRQYLMIVTGEIKSIEEEGTLALEEPTNDIEKISIRLKRLKGQCMALTGRQGLDWERGGGMDQ